MSPSCTVCGAPADTAFVTRDRNRSVTDRDFTYLRCRGCGLLSLQDPPEDLGAYYAGDYFGFPSPEALASPPVEERGQAELLRRHAPEGPVLEVGPGRGFFAAAVRAAGFEIEAVERDERSCRHLREAVGVHATQSEEPEAVLRERSRLAAVVLWQVIEHLPRPWAVLDAAAAALRPGGLVALATPNPHSLQARLLGSRWPHVDAPRHLQLIPAPALVERAGRAGLRPIRVFSNDADARRWSQFGWQRVLMNEMPGRLTRAAAFWGGASVARALWPLECRRLNGASYTAVLGKV